MSVNAWLQGAAQWNHWLKQGQLGTNITFHGVDFSSYSLVDFGGYHFRGTTSFAHANFGDADVNFAGAEFEGKVIFSMTTFGKGTVSFDKAKFKNGIVTFTEAEFGEGQKNFQRLETENCKFYFLKTKFGNGDIHFTESQFKNTHFKMSEAEFGKNSELWFQNVHFGGMALMTNLKGAENLSRFDFKYAAFDGPLDISSDEEFPCLIDLTQTKTSHHVSLENVRCKLPREESSPLFLKGDWLAQRIATDKEDIARARRLKELADGNDAHQAAQDFHVLEMQAKRNFSTGLLKFPFGFLLHSEFWYEKLGDYGRSIMRPLAWIGIILLGFSGIYTAAAQAHSFFKGFLYSATQMFAFMPVSKGARIGLEEALYGENVPDFVYFCGFMQGGISLVLLFLLGLGIRHRYRI